MTRSRFWTDAQYIEHLEEKLDRARDMVIDSVQDQELRRLLGTYSDPEYKSEQKRFRLRKWETETATKIAERAQPLPEKQWDGRPRAACPLCGSSGSGAFYTNGYLITEGLMLHLMGEKPAWECDIFAIAKDIAKDYWDRHCAEADAAAERAIQQQHADRLATETLYRVDASREAKLIDSDRIWWPGQARDAAGFAWAEERLQSMGFKTLTDGKVKEYLDQTDQYAVWADPRGSGRITFKVYGFRTDKRRRSGQVLSYAGEFRILDTAKNQLADKYRKRRDAVLSRGA